MITQYDEAGNAQLTNTTVGKPTGVTTTQSLASQYQSALAAAAARARDEELRKRQQRMAPGFGVPGYWWNGMTPYIAPGGVAAPVMTAGNGAGYNPGALGIADPYAGVTGADPATTVTVPAEAATAADVAAQAAETPAGESVIRPAKPKLYSEAPAWAKKYENPVGLKTEYPGNDPQHLPIGFVNGNQANGGMPGWMNTWAQAIGAANSGSNWWNMNNQNNQNKNFDGFFDYVNNGLFKNLPGPFKDFGISEALGINPKPKYYGASEVILGGPYGPNRLPNLSWVNKWADRNNKISDPAPSTDAGTGTGTGTGSGFGGGLWGGGGGYGGGGGGGYNPYWNWNLINWNVR